MEWQNPEFLYLILPLTAAWFALALYSHRKRQQARYSFVSAALASRILPEESSIRFWFKMLLREGAIVLGLVALAGPRYGTQYEDVVARGSDLYVLVDVSRSMLADDVPPTRLGRAKADISALVNQLEGERVGLIAFAGQAVVKCPLTVDYDSFRRALEELDPDSAPRGGTAIGDAIRKAVEVFHANAERDQAILLITDGDDQQSYPMEAAALAAERQVTIFTVGLGDADQGARIPQKSDSKTYVEYEGQQVWSKLQGNLLQDIALKTSGVYVPAGTRAYDLGELYAQHLRGRQGAQAVEQKRIRRSEQFQIFLALALAALWIDFCTSIHASTSSNPAKIDLGLSANSEFPEKKIDRSKMSKNFAAFISVLVLLTVCQTASSSEPTVDVRDGIKFYSQSDYDAAREKFTSANEELEKQKSAAAAIAAFDAACASHRKEDWENARDGYLRAGLSQDRSIAVAAHFNLGNLSTEQAKKLAGERPETIALEKRGEILDHLKHAIAAYRHVLEIQADHPAARRNLELVRLWIKYYTDQWNELDRQKRRDESNLLVFLEYLIQNQSTLRESAKTLPVPIRADPLAELKRLQDELREEIPTLKDKIGSELRPKPTRGGTPTPQQPALSPSDSQKLEEGIALLQSWADAASERMRIASENLVRKEILTTTTEQLHAVEELEKIWDAIIPFHPLLVKELGDQTSISEALRLPKPVTEDTHSSTGQTQAAQDAAKSQANSEKKTLPVPESVEKSPDADAASETKSSPATPTPEKPDGKAKPDGQAESAIEKSHRSVIKPVEAGEKSAATDKQELAQDELDFLSLFEREEKVLKRARLIGPKAEAELNRLEKGPAPEESPPSPAGQPQDEGKQTVPKPVQPDPEQAKAGYRKAIELAPQAVGQLEAAVKALHKKERLTSAEHSEKARKILEEILQAQPKNDSPQKDQQKQDKDQDEQQKDQEKNEQKNDSQKNDKQEKPEQSQDKKEDQNKSSDKDRNKQNQDQSPKDQKSEDQKTGDNKQDEQKQPEKKTDSKQPSGDQPEQSGKRQSGQISSERIEEALRKVRERQQAKRDRDRKLKVHVLGRSPVDKDW